MNKPFQSLDEIMREEEARLLAEARAKMPAELEAAKQKAEAKRLARANVPVWIVHDDELHGPFANDEAGEAFVESKKWDFSECFFFDSEKEAKQYLNDRNKDDEDDEEEDE